MENILTQKLVKCLGLDKVSVITADMLDGYTSIEEDAFESCSGLTSIEISNSVTSIGDYAFYKCTGLTSVTIPNSVTSIGDYAFYKCSGLTSIEIPNSVTSIGNSAFSGCMGLTSVHISDIAAWCAISFGEYGANPLFYAHNLYLNGELVTDLVIPNSVKSIGSRAFKGCSGLTSVTIPNSITSIGDYAFYNCDGLTSVTISNSVTSIGKGAFSYCSGLTSVTIGNKIYKQQTVTNGKCKAYKAFNGSMKCRDFQYEKGKTYEFDCEPKLCECGFHACLKLADVFNYYHGEFGIDIVVHEVNLEGVSSECNELDSKVVAKKITIGKRIL